MKNIFFLLLTILLFIFSCEKPEKEVQSDNDTKNIITCNVNGSAWQSDPASKNVYFMLGTRKSSEFVYKNGSLFITGIRSNPSDTTAVMLSAELTALKTGTYILNGYQIDKWGAFLMYNDQGFFFINNYSLYAELNITKFDSNDKKISGTFNIKMTAKSSSNSDITVTDGKFEDAVLDIE